MKCLQLLAQVVLSPAYVKINYAIAFIFAQNASLVSLV